ncbi:GMC oxidoreductase [Pseudanabaena sp. 'Roaring Creek']|uniref:GMC oxidoreductase n=1 Tax=Pseudanabaena sp. 'Roaring Creek' TaxID=1681830 RepID=UPI0006D7A02D|nr:GMC family oxidoreductase [Pseudanabaena sp. 'Roaring Creek']
MSPHPSTEVYDAIVVGSGANGGVAAKELSERGLKVLVLEAGRTPAPTELGNNVKDMAKRFYNLAIAKRQSYQSMHPGYWKANPDLFIDEKDNPYTTPPEKPFYWIRGRQVGGKSLTWGGITLRLSDYEFKAASRDGYDQDWPIAYADLAPYYSKLEKFFQVRGSQEGLDQLPDGEYQPTLPLTPAEQYLQEIVEKKWSDRRLIPSRGFGLHRPTPSQPWPMYSSLGSSLKAAIATGNVTLRSDAVVSHAIFDPESRKARGVVFIDRQTKQAHEAFAKTVILCASTIESVRILLHSTEQYQPAGLTNPSGMLGHYLMDHVSTSTFFLLPHIKQTPKPFDLSGCDSFFIPCFSNLASQQERFLRGYGIWGGVQRFDLPNILRKVGDGSIGFMIAHGEVLPRYRNQIELNPDVVDAWGIPVPHIECAWSDNEHLMLDHMHRQIDEIIKIAGGKSMQLTDIFHVPVFSEFVSRMEEVMAFSAPPGYYIHEVGGARMGTSPTNSVVNEHNQLWESPNLFVTDGACWTSSGWQSPTLTEMAITARASEFISEQLRKGVF